MRGIRIAGVGVALAVSATSGVGQSNPPAPAATLGRAIPVEGNPGTVVRAAAPDTRAVTPLFTRGLFRTRTQAEGGGQPSTTLPPPRPVEGQPNVTEQRGPGTAPPPPMTQPGGGPGTQIPMGYVAPPPGYPSYVVPGSGVAVPGPVVGPQPCDPVYGTAGIPTATIPVTPSAPAVGVGQTVPQPAVRLEDPYLAPYNPLFPRVRSAVNTVLDAPLANDRFTLGAEYLLWFARAQSSPPLLSTSSPQYNGILGTGDSQVVFGNQSLAPTLHSGARFSGLYRLSNLWYLDGNIWFLGRNGGEFTATSAQYPVLARPFFNVNNNSNFAQVIASPGLATGAANIKYDTTVWGSEVNLRRAFLCGPCSRLDFLIGFRNLNLMETLQVTETFARTPDSPTSIGVPTALSGTVVDSFRTENHFYGVNLGFAGELRRSWWFVQARAAVGLGSMYQSANINGSQTITTTSGVQTAEGGLLALPGANIGGFSQRKFAAVPEVGLTLGLNLTPNLRFGVGYNFMYASSVVRPSGQIDPGLDVNRIPNFPLNPTPPTIAGVRPAGFPLKTSDYFVQGVTFSLFWTW